VTIALLGGQLLGSLGHAQLLAGASAVAAAVTLLVGHARHHWIAVCLCAAAVGLLQVDAVLLPRFPANHIVHLAGQTLVVSGTVRDCVGDAAGRTRLTVDVDAIDSGGTARTARGRALITVAEATLPWQPGDRAAARLRLRRPRNFGNPGEFDYEAFLARRGIYVTAFAMTDAAWERNALADAQRAFVAQWRAAIRVVLSQSLTGVAHDITAALIIGDTAPLPPLLWQRYARTGVAHVLSISGLHISLVASAGYVVMRWLMSRSEWLLLRTNVPKLSWAAAIIPMTLYGLLAGASAPTLRSLIVVAIFVAGMLVDRRRDWLTSLAAAALLISVLWPGAVFEIAFQLSFMSVLSIMIGMQPIVTRWRAWEEQRLLRLRPAGWRERAGRALVLTLATTASAAIGTAPLTAYHFNQISLITFVANLLVIPLLGIVPISTGLLAALCVPILPAVSAFLFRVGGLFIVCADWTVALLSQVPGAALRTVSPTIFELILLYTMLGIALLRRTRWRQLAAVLCVALLSADVGSWYWERFHGAQLRVTFLSVGHGDCAVVELPGSTVMVVDGGGLGSAFDVGERVVAPYLWRRKIARVDALVLSHADYDHYGGLDFLARTFSPQAVWWNGVDGHGQGLRKLWETLGQQGIPTRVLGRGFSDRVDGVRVEVLAPDPEDRGSLNDRSLVLRLSYGPTAILFTGDLEAEGEQRLIERSAGTATATILKAPHHGSHTSSSEILLASVRPQIAVISTGFANRFRMPHADVLARFAARGTRVWRTDLDGAVVVTVSADGTVDVTGTRPRPSVRRDGAAT
jgi:competence protein ComEC